MAKLRLTHSARSMLDQLYRKTVTCPAEMAAVEKAYVKVAPVVRKAVEAKWPVADMAALRKYQTALHDKCIKLQLTAGGVDEFKFAETDDAPLRPDRYDCRHQIYLTDERLTKAFEVWKAATDALKAASLQKEKDYNALIQGSTYLEEVEAVWPEASQIRVRLHSNLPATLTNDTIARIKADAATRMKAAA